MSTYQTCGTFLIGVLDNILSHQQCYITSNARGGLERYLTTSGQPPDQEDMCRIRGHKRYWHNYVLSGKIVILRTKWGFWELIFAIKWDNIVGLSWGCRFKIQIQFSVQWNLSFNITCLFKSDVAFLFLCLVLRYAVSLEWANLNRTHGLIYMNKTDQRVTINLYMRQVTMLR